MNSLSRNSTASIVWLLICAFAFTQFLSPSTYEPCKPIIKASRIVFMNNIVLEYEKYGFGKDTKHSRSNTTNTPRGKGTVVVVNGIAQPVAENERKQPQSNIRSAHVHHSSNRYESNTDDRFNIARGPNLNLLGCSEIDGNFHPFKDREVQIHDGIFEIFGLLNHPAIGRVSCVLKKANVHDKKAYRGLQDEKRKRLLFGTNTRISYRMFGECERANELQIVLEHDETSTSLCDDVDEYKTYSYVDSKCFHNEKLQNLIEKSRDKTRSAFIFLRELLCLFAEVEEKDIFVKDIHGKHISVNSNFSVTYKNIDVLAHYGSRNILSGSTCKFDEDCPRPEGELWNNMSANYATYSKCLDANPSCSDYNSCYGYNARLHICGICHWLLQPLYHFFTRLKDRSRITSIIMSTINRWPQLRGSAMESCKKITNFYDQYEKDMKKTSNQKNSRAFHSGKRMQAK